MDWLIHRAEDVDRLARTLFAGGLAKSEDEAIKYVTRELRRGDVYLIADNPSPDAPTGAGLVTWLQEGADRHGLVELNHICVIPEFQGRGLARELFAHLEQEVKAFFELRGSKLRKIYLKTHDSNVDGQRFYEKLGLTHEDTLHHHYRRGVHEFVFSKYYDV